MGTYRTYPDWNVTPGQLPSPDIDTGELAARLDSPSLLRRRGKVIFFDSLDDNLGSWVINQPDAGIYGFSPSALLYNPYRGDGCCRLTPGGTNISYIHKFIPYIASRKIGVEFMGMTARGLGAPDYFTCNLDHGDSVRTFEFALRVDIANNLIQLWLTGSVWQTVFTPLFNWGYPEWHNLKMVVNVETGFYDVLEYDENTLDISSFQCLTGGASSGLDLAFSVTDAGGNSGFLDDVIVTIDEA